MGAQAVRLSNVDIDNALKNKDFEVLFQPIFDLGNGALARMEAFVRWRHSTLGMLPPGAFISFFESQGRMSELTRYVLGRALDRYISWRGPYSPGISINLALSDLSDEAFLTHMTVLLREHDFPADLITLECPMPPVHTPIEESAESFKRLASTGARLAIEVRGRANDLLRAIEPFPFDEIKTGGAAILRFARTVRGPGLSAISELLDIASQANAAITAVGVEDQASLAALRGLGFTAAQGNHLGKVGALSEFLPSRVNEVRELLALEPLSTDDLTALFRTSAPTPKLATETKARPSSVQAPSATEEATEKAKTNQSTRKRRAKPSTRARTENDTAREDVTAKSLDPEANEKLKRKAAAIARAKKKAAAKTKRPQEPDHIEKPARSLELTEASDTDITPETNTKAYAARKLQERLSEEFSSEEAVTSPKPKINKPAATEPNVERSLKVKAGKRVASGALDDPNQVTRFESIPNETRMIRDETDQESNAVSTDDEDIVWEEDDPITIKSAMKDGEEPATQNQTLPSEDIVSTPIDENVADPKNIEVRATADQAGKPMDAGEFEGASISIGHVAAHFRPVMRVGGLDTQRLGPPPPVPADDIIEIFLDDDPKEPAPPTPNVKPVQESKLSLSIEPEIFEETPASDGSDELEFLKVDRTLTGQPSRRLRKQSKNLLRRKYRLWPNHFWPRSWKRYWREHHSIKQTHQARGN